MRKSSRSIAIVDDDAPVLKSLKRLLCGRGYAVAAYGSARDFLATVSGTLPDCLIIDLQMPEMTGLELHQHLKRLGIRIPTIVITAHGGDHVRERCFAAGATAYLSKPLEIPTLLDAIEAAVE